MARIPDPSDRLSPAGRELLAKLSARRGQVDDMYRTMLLNPELTEAVSTLGTYLRFGSGALSDRHRELVILRVARMTGAAYEWVKHEPKAREAGIDEQTLEAMRRGEDPDRLEPGERALVEAADVILERGPLPERLQARLVAEIGEPALLELVVLVGFYATIAGFIAAFEVPLPEGAEQPFDQEEL
jgi:4-carboxymuconolactone decarboxylase